MNEGAGHYSERIEACIDEAERKIYYQTSWPRSLWTFAHIWFGLGFSFWGIYILQREPLVLQLLCAPFLAAYIGTRINAFAVQVHEASHGCLMKNKRLNSVFCNCLGAYLVLNDVSSDWRVHREHHAHLHEETDPDRPLYLLHRGDLGSVALTLLQDLCWISAAKRILHYLRNGNRKTSARGSLINALGKFAAQAIVLVAFIGAFGPYGGLALYFVYWLIPLFSVFPVLIRIRIVTGHYAEVLSQNSPVAFVSRTSVSNLLEAYLIGVQMEYHFEHHLFPRMPYHQLKRFHRALAKKGFFEGMCEEQDAVLSGGYIHFWRSLLSGKIHARLSGVSS